VDIKNISPLGDLVVPALGLEVAAGAVITVKDDEIAAGLLEQTDVWAPAKTTPAPKATEAAPATEKE
jgi:hypothetical protein